MTRAPTPPSSARSSPSSITDVDCWNGDVWDCIVVGAGPAGAMAARQAAIRGLRTLLVERKVFPREKVCGACLNQRALTTLAEAGLGSLVADCGGVPLNRFQLRCLRGGGDAVRELSLQLPGGAAVSRAALDESLVRAAEAAGVQFLSGTSVKVLPREPRQVGSDTDPRELELSTCDVSREPHRRTIRSRVIIAADGLGHPSLKRLTEFPERVSASSRIGVGGVVSHEGDLPAGVIGMAVANWGYAGLVRIEDGRLNVAACLDEEVVRHAEHPGAPLIQLLEQSGFGTIRADLGAWTGTPKLTRVTETLASDGVFVVGDAAGYVEPFTGEGIASALVGGLAVADCAARAVRGSRQAAEQRWRQQWEQLVWRRQQWCRRLAWMLRRPRAIGAAVRVAAAFPALARPIVLHLNSPRRQRGRVSIAADDFA
ncbi:MAG: FAD-dependent monooxygenase [Planctomycetales bacterium]|nr:FAD-dependent monooxygenase [Planctomycetales bacterium]